MSNLRFAAFQAFAFLASLALSACGFGDRAPSVVRADSAGAALVTSGDLDVPLARAATEAFALGGEAEGLESFYSVSPLGLGADGAGRIHVLDGASHRVVVFDRDGGAIRALGRQGGGPGELEMPGMLGVTSDGTISVFDYGKGALVMWDSAGTLLPERPFPHIPSWGGRHHALTADGYVTSTGGQNAAGDRVNRVLLVTGEDTATLGSIPQPGQGRYAMFESCGGGVSFPPLFTPHVVWHHRDGITAVVPGPGYRIDLYDGPRLVRSIRRTVDPVPATRELAIAEAGEGFTINFGRGPCTVPPGEYVDARGFAEVVPAIADLMLTPGGDLWVKRWIPGEENPPIDVFAADGAYRGTLPAGTAFPALMLPGGAVGVIRTDEMDVDRLVVLEPAD